MRKLQSNYAARLFMNAMCSLLMMVSCDDDKPQILPSVIQFTANLQNVAEGEEATVVLTLDRAMRDNGSVQLSLQTNAVYGQHFETDPSVNGKTILLEVRKGQTSVEFKIATINNDKYEGTRFIVFQLEPQSDGLKAGELSALTFTIGDDEGPSQANFIARSATIHETDGDGIVVEIPFTAPARGEGSLTVTLHAGMAIHGTNFTIDQELTNSAFSFNVVRNATGVSFKLFPMDNDLFTGDFPLDFTITDVSGVVQKGNITTYRLTLVDDEAPTLVRFALAASMVEETREEGIGVDILLSGPVKGEGTMTIALTGQNLAYGTDFTTLPEADGNRITLELSHDQTAASIKVFPKNDDVLWTNRALLFLILHTTGPVVKGNDSLAHELAFVDDEQPTVATFAANSATVDETNSAGLEVQIMFSHRSPAAGRIVLNVEGFDRQFTSEPEVAEILHYDSYSSYYSGYYYTYEITVDVPLHAAGASFKVFPINNGSCAVSERVTFTMSKVSGGIIKENEPEFELTIDDDEDPMKITFAEPAGTLEESNSAGKEISVNFSKPAVRSGTVWISLNYPNHYHSERYTTVPEMQYASGYYGDYAPLEFKAGATGVAFKIFPVNDNVAKEDFTEEFYLSYYPVESSDGCVQTTDEAYTFTFVDDD